MVSNSSYAKSLFISFRTSIFIDVFNDDTFTVFMLFSPLEE